MLIELNKQYVSADGRLLIGYEVNIKESGRVWEYFRISELRINKTTNKLELSNQVCQLGSKELILTRLHQEVNKGA